MDAKESIGPLPPSQPQRPGFLIFFGGTNYKGLKELLFLYSIGGGIQASRVSFSNTLSICALSTLLSLFTPFLAGWRCRQSSEVLASWASCGFEVASGIREVSFHLYIMYQLSLNFLF